jgi:hypothetical protein
MRICPDNFQRAAQRLALPAGGRDEAMPLDGINLKPRKVPENAPTPTSRVHAVLGGVLNHRIILP